MEKTVIFQIVLRSIFHLILFIVFVQFYLIEQMGDYIADRITTTSRFQEVKTSDFPTITMCMNPPQKSSVAKKFGFKSMQDIHFQEVENLTLLERFEAISYKLNQDFYINDFIIGNNKEFVIEPIVTYFQGICYKLEPTFKINSQFESKTFRVQFSKEIKALCLKITQNVSFEFFNFCIFIKFLSH